MSHAPRVRALLALTLFGTMSCARGARPTVGEPDGWWEVRTEHVLLRTDLHSLVAVERVWIAS